MPNDRIVTTVSRFLYVFSSPEPKAPGVLVNRIGSCPSSSVNTFKRVSSEATGPVWPKFHLWHLWAGGTESFFL